MAGGRRTRHTTAIVIDRTKLGESDLILTLLEADGSQGRAVAKGARKPGGKLAARVQLFCELDLLLAVGRNLDVVAEAQLTEPHATLRGDLARVSAASVVCEVARLTSFPDAPDTFLSPICSCVACGEVPVTRFSALAGGALCESCAREVEGAEPVDATMLAWLEALVRSTFDQLLAAPVEAALASELLALVHVWAVTHLDARLRAYEFNLSV